tara:strand:+ start:378 stop:1265 length:888 start_codon:yes stop_codon:yes gene_type:complete
MIDTTGFYRIENQVSGMFLLAGSWGKVPTDKLVWQYALTDDIGNGYYDPDGFLWQFVSDNNGYYKIVNKVSGMFLLAGSWGKVPSDRAMWQYALTDGNTNGNYDPDGFLWSINDQGNIINKVSGFGLLAGSWGALPSDKKVWQYPLTDGDPKGFLWKLIPTITLYVDADYATTLTTQTVDTYCSFGQNKSQTTNENFLRSVNVGDTVIWRGETTPPSSNVIDITQVKKENVPGSSNVFGGNGILQGIGDPETVTGTVQAGTGGENETYTIFFKVNGTGQQFQIDPKIKVNPQTQQ